MQVHTGLHDGTQGNLLTLLRLARTRAKADEVTKGLNEDPERPL